MRRMKFLYASGLVVLAGSFMPFAKGASDHERINQFKAAYVFKMARFVDWGSDDTEIKLCMAPGVALERYQSSLNNRPLDNNRTLRTSVEALNPSCHLYFGPTDANVSIPPSTLAIGDHQDTLQNGGHIELFLEEGRLQFRMNKAEIKLRAREGDFRVSSKLMRLARRT